jgi:potassium efflux system protein
VWAFVKELGNRYPLMHELNTAINRALCEQGIEIPSPQLDIHVRSIVTTPQGIRPLKDDTKAGHPSPEQTLAEAISSDFQEQAAKYQR